MTTLPISGIGIWGAISHGMMAGQLPPEAVLLELQVYLGMMSVMFLAVAAEVSHRRRHELTLERHAGILREQAKVVELAPLLVRDTDDRIVRWNAGAEGLYGFTSSEARGKISHTLLQTRFPEPLERIRAKLFAEGCLRSAHSLDFPLASPKGSPWQNFFDGNASRSTQT